MRIHPAAIVCLFVPWLLAPKCVPADPALFAPVSLDASIAVLDGVAPAVPCPKESTAQLRVQNYAYKVICGCAETKGSKSCTIKVGTAVTWTFADTEEHNVASLGNSFGASNDMLAGTYTQTFDTAGSFEYKCGLHPEDMSGYHIVVVE